MAAKLSYAEQLCDPRWQKRRLEVFERADWTCERCGGKARNLQVHHGYYARGMMAWDYPIDSLHCCCDRCHKSVQSLLELIHELIGKMHVNRLPLLLARVRDEPMPEVRTAPPSQVTDADVIALFARRRAEQGACNG